MCRIVFVYQDEADFEVEDIRNYIYEFELDMINEHFNEREEIVKEHDEIEEESEYETEDLLQRMFDGQLFAVLLCLKFELKQAK